MVYIIPVYVLMVNRKMSLEFIALDQMDLISNKSFDLHHELLVNTTFIFL